MKRFLKIAGISLVSLVMLICAGLYIGARYYKDQFFTAAKNRIEITRNDGPFYFEWSASDFDGYQEPHGAQYFPVTIKGINRPLYMQWDCGAPSSIIYQPVLYSLLTEDKKPDTIKSGSTHFLKDFVFTVGGTIDVKSGYVRLMDYGEIPDLSDSVSPVLIGTLGTDFIDGHVFSMNFKTKEVNLYSDRSKYQDVTFEKFEYVGRRILLPSSIDESDALLFYDSGTSPFGIVTTKGKFQEYGDESAREMVYGVNSWGTKVNCHNKESSVPIAIGGSIVPMNRVSYIEWKDGLQAFFMAFSDIKGLLGNKALLNTTLVLDTRNKEFAVLK